MEDKNKIKLIKFKELLNQEVVLIGESIDWSVMGSKLNRDSLKRKGVEFTLMKKSYMSYFYKDIDLFRGNVIIVSFKKNLTYKGVQKAIQYLEKELGVLPLFIIINKRVISMNYFMNLIKDGVMKESLSLLLSNTLKNQISQLNVVNKNIIKILSKIK